MQANRPAQAPANASPERPLPGDTSAYALIKRRRRGLWLLVLVVLLVGTSVLGTRIAATHSTGTAVLAVRVEQQQPLTLYLQDSAVRSPFVFGTNVFPASGTRALDGAYGFMPYDANTVAQLKAASITMLRFPGGTWGEAHTPSNAQLNAVFALAHQTNTKLLMQVRMAGSTPQEAARLVSYSNNPRDPARVLQGGVLPFVPVHYWVIGNEPDQTGSGYTVQDYVRDYIRFATAMKAVDPTIQIFGPEISQYDGPDAGPFDATGTAWLAGFLKGIAAYEQAHHVQILDGVSIHSYAFGNIGVASSSLLFSSAGEWQYLMPLLQAQIRQIIGTSLPVAITEINESTQTGSAINPSEAALWWADTLGALLEQHVDFVDYFAARGVAQPSPLLTQAGSATTMERVMQLYSHMAPDVIVVNSGSSPVSTYAATDSSIDMATLMFINKSAAAVTITVNPVGGLADWSSVRFQLPPYAILCAVVGRGATAREYLYVPPAQTGAAGQAGTIVEAPLH